MSRLKELFKQQVVQLFVLLGLMSLFNILLVVFRLNWVGFVWGDISNYRDVFFFQDEPTFVFLVGNLLLAWIPFVLAMLVNQLNKHQQSGIFILPIIGVWLLFFPNAPYLLTDLIHLRPRNPIPYWYDIMLFTSFAWTGLLLGLISLYPIHRFFKRYLSKPLEHGIIALLLLLCSIGIYLGRFLRWNSWDIIYQPKGLITDLQNILFYPAELFPELGISILFFCFLYPLYWLVKIMLETKVSTL